MRILLIGVLPSVSVSVIGQESNDHFVSSFSPLELSL